MEPVERGHAACDEAAMILSEISDGGFVAPEDFSGIDERAVVAAGFAQLGSGVVGEFARMALTSVVFPARCGP